MKKSSTRRRAWASAVTATALLGASLFTGISSANARVGTDGSLQITPSATSGSGSATFTADTVQAMLTYITASDSRCTGLGYKMVGEVPQSTITIGGKTYSSPPADQWSRRNVNGYNFTNVTCTDDTGKTLTGIDWHVSQYALSWSINYTCQSAGTTVTAAVAVPRAGLLDGTPTTIPNNGSLPASCPMFVDVPPGLQFFKEINWLASQGISTGWSQPDGTKIFKPVTAVNRDAMAAFLYRFAGSPAYTAPKVSPFTDVPTNSQFYKEITWLASTGVTTGWTERNGTKTFRPVTAVNRDAMAAFLYRFAGKPAYAPPTATPFTDVPTNSQFYKEITWLARLGVTTGWTEPNGTKTFRPVSAVNRDAMAAFLYRFAGTRGVG